MNLIKAIKSGKRFKRPGQSGWHDNSFLKQAGPDRKTLYGFNEVDILAEDWIIEEKEVTITASQFDKAVSRTGNLDHRDQWYWADALKKELGL